MREFWHDVRETVLTAVALMAIVKGLVFLGAVIWGLF